MPQRGENFETSFTGSPSEDPHIYAKIRGYKLVANIDSRWITTTTAFVQFRPSSGRNHFAGLGFVNDIDTKSKAINITPYVIGMPSNDLMATFYGKNSEN